MRVNRLESPVSVKLSFWRTRFGDGREPLRTLRDHDVRGFVARGLAIEGDGEALNAEPCHRHSLSTTKWLPARSR
jgi:hypothetical protein